MGLSNEGRMYSEVYSVIECMGNKYKNAIPTKLYKHICDSREVDYQPEFDMSKPLRSQSLSSNATAFICMLHYKYWCESENEKAKLKKVLDYNQKKNAEKFDVSNVFERANAESEQSSSKEAVQEQVQLVEYKENIFKKMWKKIRNLFKK